MEETPNSELPYSSTLVTNLFAGPGAGKSTTAALVFGLLKSAGLDVELVTEYAKDKVWEGSGQILANQPYVLGKQLHRLWRLQRKVQVAITDSPIALSALYNGEYEHLDALVLELHQRFNNLNYFIDRVKPYNPNGRGQTEEEARALDRKLGWLMQKFNVQADVKPGNVAGACRIAEEIYYKIKGKRMHAHISITFEEDDTAAIKQQEDKCLC